MSKTKLGLRTDTGVSIRMRTIVIDDLEFEVPKGVARNKRNKSWQIKVERNGVRLAEGNFADETYGGITESLGAAKQSLVDQLESDCVAQLGQRKVRGSRAEGMRIADHVTVNWRIVNATPSLYASVYSPRLQQVKSLHLGSDRRLASSESAVKRLVAQLLKALVMNERILEESAKPFIDVLESDISMKVGMEAQTIFHSQEFKKLLEAGSGLREYAERTRQAGFKLSKIV